MTIAPEESAALADWLSRKGRNWKAPLRAAWMAGGYDAATGEYIAGPLMALRNDRGPEWLSRFRAEVVGGTLVYLD